MNETRKFYMHEQPVHGVILEDDEAGAVNLQRGPAALGRGVQPAHPKTEAAPRRSNCLGIAVPVTVIRMPGGTGLEHAEAVGQVRHDTTAAEIRSSLPLHTGG